MKETRLFDQFIHRWLRVPYALHTTVRRVKKPRLSVLLIHGIGNSEKVWQPLIDQLPGDVQIVSVDLLGFGKSPRPHWVQYNAKTQARSVAAAYLKLGLYGQVVVVGHSLGSLVAIEMARRYPLLVKSLILCSPPLYHLNEAERKLLPHPDRVLTSLYQVLQKHPEEFVKLGQLAVRYKLITDAFQVTTETVATYMATLEAAIINQTAMKDIQQLNCPIVILHGRLDPVVVNRNLVWLAKHRPNITLQHVAAGHEIAGSMLRALVTHLRQ